MTKQPVSSLLATIDLFAHLPEDVRCDIAERGATQSFQPGRAVVEQGGTSAGLCLVLDGSADVEVDGRRVDSLFEGDYFGEISLLDGAPRLASVLAGEKGLRAWRVTAGEFAPLMDHPEVARVLLGALCARVRRAEAGLAR